MYTMYNSMILLLKYGEIDDQIACFCYWGDKHVYISKSQHIFSTMFSKLINKFTYVFNLCCHYRNDHHLSCYHKSLCVHNIRRLMTQASITSQIVIVIIINYDLLDIDVTSYLYQPESQGSKSSSADTGLKNTRCCIFETLSLLSQKTLARVTFLISAIILTFFEYFWQIIKISICSSSSYKLFSDDTSHRWAYHCVVFVRLNITHKKRIINTSTVFSKLCVARNSVITTSLYI
ncbi:hypothetical protein AGLY_006015 [Aphis glycines]|uniref:Uncharacterized protein n=1 Tax=Aphis glycines TaxID=307491 RepID=A0A6G0TT23_APHGL|nr:hypothetical protein AGLY_006015 [Aphis glycines]